MRESYKNRLPDWLEYNDKEGILYGIAPQGSAGMLFSIDVTPALSGQTLFILLYYFVIQTQI